MGKKIKIILGILAIFMIVENIGYGESLTEEKEEIYMDKIDNNAEFDEDINPQDACRLISHSVITLFCM